MAGASKQKQKLLRMEQIFKTSTDEDHTLTGNELIEILEKEGIKAERKTIYDDIATLCDSGVTIETVKRVIQTLISTRIPTILQTSSCSSLRARWLPAGF